jgi:hypothetical protein
MNIKSTMMNAGKSLGIVQKQEKPNVSTVVSIVDQYDSFEGVSLGDKVKIGSFENEEPKETFKGITFGKYNRIGKGEGDSNLLNGKMNYYQDLPSGGVLKMHKLFGANSQ